MKLLRVHVISAQTCGGLLDGLDLSLRSPFDDYFGFDPLCFVGANGSGKSQFLQIVAEIFQSVLHACVPEEERAEGNADLQFEVEYRIRPEPGGAPVRVRVTRRAEGKRRPAVLIERKDEEGWVTCDLQAAETRKLLPGKVVGYTSGANETLSLPFLTSRGEYAMDVGRRALAADVSQQHAPDTRLMLVDYGTHLEVLVANLLLGDAEQRHALLSDAEVEDLHSFRCIVQLAHSAAPKVPTQRSISRARKGVQLTSELEKYLDQLQRCATCYSYDPKTETYIYDYRVTAATKAAFRAFWNSALDLYSALHKLAMLNDLAISKGTRERFRRETSQRRFASRLPEPQDEDKVFRFERVNFVAAGDGDVVDYVSLSDGEHQLAQILGTFCMLSFPSVLFLLDEPESHFNPQWRVKFISRVRTLPTPNGAREATSEASDQECLITTHSPFLPSDMAREKVFIFWKDDEGKVRWKHPDIETYGTTFDTILEECFGVRPPISQVPLQDIDRLMKSENPDEIQDGIDRLGQSVEKAYLVARLQQLTDDPEA